MGGSNNKPKGWYEKLKALLRIVFGSAYGRAGAAIAFIGLALVVQDEWFVRLLDRAIDLGCNWAQEENWCASDAGKVQSIFGYAIIFIGVGTILWPLSEDWRIERKCIREERRELKSFCSKLRGLCKTVARAFDNELRLPTNYMISDRDQIRLLAEQIFDHPRASSKLKSLEFLGRLRSAQIDTTPNNIDPFYRITYEELRKESKKIKP